jgi:hypothetical protein
VPHERHHQESPPFRAGRKSIQQHQQRAAERYAKRLVRQLEQLGQGPLTEGYGSSWIFEPYLSCSNALRRVHHPAFSLVSPRRRLTRWFDSPPQARNCHLSRDS